MSGQYLAQGNNQEALALALRAKEVCERYDLRIELGHTYTALDHVYFQMGDYKKAYYYRQRTDALRDSSQNIKQAAEIVAMELKYEQDKKDAEAAAELQRQKYLRNWSLIGFTVTLVFSGIFLFQRNKITQAQRRSESLLLNILPPATAEELKTTGSARAQRIDAVTVMFTDFKDFTRLSEQLSAEALVQDIHYYFSAFDRIIEQYHVEKIKTIGDSYMCAAGLPASRESHAVDAAKAALEIRDFMLREAHRRRETGQPMLEIRIGLHSGPVVSGVVGIRKFAYDIWGDTVNIAARMEHSGEPGKINISSATYELIKDEFQCEYRGKIAVKNKGLVDMYFLDYP